MPVAIRKFSFKNATAGNPQKNDFRKNHANRRERFRIKLTRHNGRSGKNGTYNPRHNDRHFDLQNSEHIDSARSLHNIYWDCIQGFHGFLEDGSHVPQNYRSFEDVEQQFYLIRYSAYVNAQNERNAKRRHTERDRTTDDLWTSNKTCPEESILQIGNIDESVSPDVLLQIASTFFIELQNRYGEHFHVLDWALHLDEATPHIHERHVFDCPNRYGETQPQQEKALEKLGIPLPDPNKPPGKNNNRKMTFDKICRELLLQIAQNHELYLDKTPTYGGRDYMEKQDFILLNQQKRLAEKESALQEVSMKLSDMEALVDEIAEDAYEKACEVVTDTVREETQKADLQLIEEYQKRITAPTAKNSPEVKRLADKILTTVRNKLSAAAGQVLQSVQTFLQNPTIRAEKKEAVKAKVRESALAKLHRHQEEIRQRDLSLQSNTIVNERREGSTR